MVYIYIERLQIKLISIAYKRNDFKQNRKVKYLKHFTFK